MLRSIEVEERTDELFAQRQLLHQELEDTKKRASLSDAEIAEERTQKSTQVELAATSSPGHYPEFLTQQQLLEEEERQAAERGELDADTSLQLVDKLDAEKQNNTQQRILEIRRQEQALEDLRCAETTSNTSSCADSAGSEWTEQDRIRSIPIEHFRPPWIRKQFRAVPRRTDRRRGVGR